MQAVANPIRHRAYAYQKVFDSRKRRVRGVWRRNDVYFANLTVTDELGRKTSNWVKLDGQRLDEAKAEYYKLLTERNDDRLRPIGLKPKLADYINDAYCKQLDASGKRPSSIAQEKSHHRVWSKELGHLRLDTIRPHHLNRVLTDLAARYSARSVNLYLISIRHVLKAAARDGFLAPPLPFEGLQWRRVDNKSRELYAAVEIDQLCEVALQASKNGRVFVDYIRFMQYSGARRSESLRVRWRDVDLDRGQVTIGAEGDAKNRGYRVVDFNSKLEAHLKEMCTRRQPDSQWLFPSPQRGDRDIPVNTFMESLRLARKAAGMVCQDCQRISVGQPMSRCPHCRGKRVENKSPLLSDKLRRFGFHDLRHHFISFGVMSGLDFMTIAKWVGHRDGGILIGKVYGHLADDHRKAQAARFNFGPTIVPLPAATGMAQAVNAVLRNR